jgi:hypothetical protein
MFLYCCAAPISVFYVAVTLFTDVEANWALASFVSLTPACAWAAIDGFTRHDRGVRFAWNACVVSLVAVSVGVVGFGVAGASGVPLVGGALQRVMAGEELAAEAQAEADTLAAETGEEPFFAAVHYGRASLMAFYLPGHPTVYAASAHMEGRRTQFDEWAFTDLSQKAVNDALRGRPALMFGGPGARWPEVFERAVNLGALPAEPKENRSAWRGYGFRGFDVPAKKIEAGS